jgi:CubicO group peptidase (beta-lactamase class C family)
LGSCLTEPAIKIPFQTYVPPNLSDGWNIANPANENIDEEALNDVYEYIHDDNDIWQIRSLLVLRNRKLVAESYTKDVNDRTTPRAVWSCTQQITALLTGIAVDQGLITVNAPLSDYLPQVQADKSTITIENLLMMKSGINFNNDGFNGETSQLLRQEPPDSIDFILGLGMRASPGTQFNYNDGDPQIISAILQERTGKTMRDWANDVLFDKIGIGKLQWSVYKDGITMGAFGILTTPREMAKIGQLILNDGMWENEQIVSLSWINEMTSSKVPDNETREDNITFGYYWWRDTGRNIMIMRGHGGQYVFINKSKNLIVVITSEPNTQGDFQLSLGKGLAIYDRINSITIE